MPTSPFSFVNFLHSGAGGQRFSPLNVSAQAGQPPGQQRATFDNVAALRALIMAGAAPQRLTGSGGYISQSDPLASLPGVNFLARMNPGFQGGR